MNSKSVARTTWHSSLYKAMEDSLSNFSSNWRADYTTAMSESCSDTIYYHFRRVLGGTILHYVLAIQNNWHKMTTASS